MNKSSIPGAHSLALRWRSVLHVPFILIEVWVQWRKSILTLLNNSNFILSYVLDPCWHMDDFRLPTIYIMPLLCVPLLARAPPTPFSRHQNYGYKTNFFSSLCWQNLISHSLSLPLFNTSLEKGVVVCFRQWIKENATTIHFQLE